jgi:glutathione S-transferase
MVIIYERGKEITAAQESCGGASGMDRMKLHWSPRSPFVRKVMIVANELGVADRIQTVRTVVQMTEPNLPLLADNPLGKIPTLVLDDGTTIFDSLTICEYLDALAGPALFPAAGQPRWTALTWHALGHGLMDLAVLWRNERDKPQARQTAEWLHGFGVKAAATLDAMETLAPRLGATPYGIGHVAIGGALGYLDFRFAPLNWRDSRPALAAWQAGFDARPAVQATVVAEG